MQRKMYKRQRRETSTRAMEEGTWMEWRRMILVMPETVSQKSDCALDMQSNKKFMERKRTY